MKEEVDINKVWKVGNSYTLNFTIVDSKEFNTLFCSMANGMSIMGIKIDNISLQDELSLQDMLNKNREKLTQIMDIINGTGEIT